MNTIDFDPKKFSKDAYGNLIPRGGKDEINRPRPKQSRFRQAVLSDRKGKTDTK